MPKVKTSRTKEPPEGFDEIEEVVRQPRGAGGCQNMAEAGFIKLTILSFSSISSSMHLFVLVTASTLPF